LPCPDFYLCCNDNTCVDYKNDSSNCGRCGNSCYGAVCCLGECCHSGEICKSTCCVPLHGGLAVDQVCCSGLENWGAHCLVAFGAPGCKSKEDCAPHSGIEVVCKLGWNPPYCGPCGVGGCFVDADCCSGDRCCAGQCKKSC
jgi:hypothetical protein